MAGKTKTKIDGLTPLNVRAIEETIPPDLGVSTTKTTATFAMSAADALTLVSTTIDRLSGGNSHPRGSLQAVRRKLAAEAAAAPVATKEEVEGAIRDALAGDPSAAEAIVAKTAPDALTEEELLASAAAAAPVIEEAAREMAKERTARKAAAAKAPGAKAKTAKPKAAKAKPATPPEAETPDLTKALLDGLKAEGIEARAIVSPAGNFYRVEIDEKTTIAFVNYRAKGALRIEPRLSGGRAPKGFTAQEKVRQGLGFVATLSTEKEIALAVAALKLAAEKAHAEKTAKAAAPAAAAEGTEVAS